MWNFKKYAENTAAASDEGIRLTYNGLYQWGERLAERVGKRCLVFLLCTSRAGSLAGYTAFLNHKIVPLLLDSHLDSSLLWDLLEIYQPKYLWIPAERKGEFHDFEICWEDLGYVLVQTCYKRECRLYGNLGLLLTTSGSTGSPKLVRQSYENIYENAKSITQYLELEESEKAITTLPMNYTYGLSIINSHLMAGAQLLMTEKGIFQKGFWEFFKKEQATSFGGVPYTYEMLEKLNFFDMDLPSLRTMTQAGGKLPARLHQKFAEYAARTGRHFVVMYGQTEATARMGYLPWQKSLEKYGSMGIAIPGGKFRLLDEDGREVKKPHTTGELVYEGANVTLGYAECADDLAKGDERNGVLQTGDMAECDEDGYYYIVGRKKRFLKIYGNRVNLDEIDRMLKGQFAGIDCTSCGTDDHMCLFVTEQACAQQAREFVISKTRLHPAAVKVFAIDEIPRNEAGKIMYQELERYDKH